MPTAWLLALVLTVSGCAVADQPGAAAPQFGVNDSPWMAGADDGFIAEGASVSPFDTSLPAISKLDAPLRQALQKAAAVARHDGIAFRVNSGWRDARYQQFLLDRAVSRYGNVTTARRYVATPEKSAHVRGAAVDIGPLAADSWLSQHGSEYGLCQTYANELWHYELSTTPGGTCPPQLADASGG